VASLNRWAKKMPQMNTEDATESVGLICVRCGQSNDERASRCSECGAPLDDFAATSPWEIGTAKSAAYQPVANPRTKPIVFWGIWLFFGPSVIGSFVMAFGLFREFVTDWENADVTAPLMIVAVFLVLYGLGGAWALWSTAL